MFDYVFGTAAVVTALLATAAFIGVAHMWQTKRNRPTLRGVLTMLGYKSSELPSPLLEWDMSEATRACEDCRALSDCRNWIASRTNPHDYQRFCPNAGLFDALAEHSESGCVFCQNLLDDSPVRQEASYTPQEFRWIVSQV